YLNLVGWIAIARLAESVGDDLWNYEAAAGRSLRKALRWLIDRCDARDWPKGLPVEAERLAVEPLRAAYSAKYEPEQAGPAPQPPFSLDPMLGMAPFWPLQRELSAWRPAPSGWQGSLLRPADRVVRRLSLGFP
ncbi:MAG: alginate lyase family protein, partial [Rhizobiales bacterium]|nr:alginate lyase family protein [Hyphomicrobiales bacterium]